ncbi:hypothetical protein [Inhella proteolytica]|uniref:Uncharacterized protein n=1 Tax=Inhella proteolytica TaxID=2795029 RepID=A0A931J2P8_9BURK|nr:hypothetical protein [Inhella proteolytica]MBH9577211.1 hypothetical protein [Inhella proteolytica]
MAGRTGLGMWMAVGLACGLAAAQARPPALQDVDSRGFSPWLAQALASPHMEDLDWAAHLLLFCAEPERWLDRVRSADWAAYARPGVRVRVVSLNERAARLCQTVDADQLAQLPELATRLEQRGHPTDSLRALAMSPAERQAARERAQERSPQQRQTLWHGEDRSYWVLWTLRLCAPDRVQADPDWQAVWERLEATRQAQQLPAPAVPLDRTRRPRVSPHVLEDLRLLSASQEKMEKQLLQHCPAARDSGR